MTAREHETQRALVAASLGHGPTREVYPNRRKQPRTPSPDEFFAWSFEQRAVYNNAVRNATGQPTTRPSWGSNPPRTGDAPPARAA